MVLLTFNAFYLMFYHHSEAKHDSSEIQTDNMICLRWDLIQLLKMLAKILANLGWIFLNLALVAR